MKRILIIHFNMELGGAESSLLGLLDTIDYSKYAADLFLLSHSGEFMPLITDSESAPGGSKRQSTYTANF